MTPEEKELKKELLTRELCRKDPYYFIKRMTPQFKDGWHVRILADVILAVKEALENPDDESLKRRFIITMPPRHAKSQSIARCGILWLLAHFPHMEFLVATYASTLAEDHGEWVRNSAKEDALFKTVFPEFEIHPGSAAKNKVLSVKNGGARFVGRGGGTTGRGAHAFVIDDILADREEAESQTILDKCWDWYWSVAETRLAPGGVVVLMHTRWSVGDLIGRVLKHDKEVGANEWTEVNFPLIAEKDEYHPLKPSELVRKHGEVLHAARYPLRWAERLRKNMPERDFLSLYQQKPMVESGNFFKKETMNFVEPHEIPLDSLNYYLACDLAVGTKRHNDPSLIWVYGVDKNKNIYLMPDFVHDRIDTWGRVNAILDLAEKYSVFHIAMEKGVIAQGDGPILRSEMQRRGRFFHFEATPVRGKKQVKAESARALMGAGKFFFPNTTRVRLYVIPELLAFPDVPHDECTDVIGIMGHCVQNHIAYANDDDHKELSFGDEDDEHYDEYEEHAESLSPYSMFR